MAFIRENFSPLGSNAKRGSTPQHFSYITTDPSGAINGSTTYFLEVFSLFQSGDIIHVLLTDNIASPTEFTEMTEIVVLSTSSSSVVTRPLTVDFYNTSVYMADVSTAGSVWVPPLIGGTAAIAVGTLGGTIATADAAITVEIDGTEVGAGVFTASGSQAGDVITIELDGVATNNVTDPVEIITDGASTNTIPVQWTVAFRPFYV